MVQLPAFGTPSDGNTYSIHANNSQIGVIGDNAQVQYFLQSPPALRQRLRPPYKPLPANPSPLSLLLPEHSVVSFDSARGPDLDRLRSWCLNETAMVALLVGPGGTGKTRLAAELAQSMRDDGWAAGFLQDEVVDDAPVLAEDSYILAILDYAETRADLAEILVDVQVLRERGVRAKVLLNARAAGGWWEELPTTGSDFARLQEALRGATVVDLADRPLEGDLDERYWTAARAFAQQQRLAPPDVLPRLEGSTNWTYLLIALAALDAVGTPDHPGPFTTAAEPPGVGLLLDTMLAREQGFWRSSAAASPAGLTGTSLRVLSRTVLCLSLVGAVDETDAAETLRARVPDLSDATEERRRALATWVRGIYPGDDSSSVWTAGIQPDLLAERFAVGELAKAPALQNGFLVGLEEDQAERALTVIGRALNHSSEQARPLLVSALRADPTSMLIPAIQVALFTPADFDRAVGAVVTDVGQHLPVTLREEMLEGVPRHEGALRHTAAALARLVVADERAEGDPARLAGALLNLTNRLLAIGAHDDGVAAAEEAVRLRRRLYDERPERQAAAFARALNGLSNALAKVNRLGEAVKAAEQLVHLRGELYAFDPEAYRPTLAKGLNTLGNRLSELAASTHRVDHYAAAAAAFREAEDLYDLFSRVYDYDRANTLNNQARVLAPLKRHDEAMQRLQKAERLYRSMLVTAAPEEVPSTTVALARTLVNLATLCSELVSDREEEARRIGLPAAREAASYLEPLADAFPALYSAQVSNLREVLNLLLGSPRSTGLTHDG